MKTILAVTKSPDVIHAVRTSLEPEWAVDSSSGEEPMEMLGKKQYDYLFIDLEELRVDGQSGDYKAALRTFWKLNPAVGIIILSAQETIKEAISAVKAGASNYLTYPIDPEEVRFILNNAHASLLFRSEPDYLRDHFWDATSLEIIRTDNPLMKKVYEKVRSVAPTRSTVLLTGETGTGKGVIANLIHQHSNRRGAPFISVHCGAIPDTLLESELFGHEKGAFTGAVRKKLGKFEIASGGTIFLDEIGTLTPPAQIKLLQVLQDATFQRVGGEEISRTDVRIIAATNMDLKQMCELGQFRKDLFYRLNVFPLEIPPLRDRLEDIPHLSQVFLKKMNKYYSKEINGIHPQVLKAFENYSWPGNIREMENLVERAYILETNSMLTRDNFPNELFEFQATSPIIPFGAEMTLAEVRRKSIADIEKRYLGELLSQKNGKISDSAAAAGITTRQLHKLMTRYGLRKGDFKKRPAAPRNKLEDGNTQMAGHTAPNSKVRAKMES